MPEDFAIFYFDTFLYLRMKSNPVSRTESIGLMACEILYGLRYETFQLGNFEPCIFDIIFRMAWCKKKLQHYRTERNHIIHL